MIRIPGSAYGSTYEYRAEEVSRTDHEAVYRTLSQPPHEMRLTPRYEGSRIGDQDVVTQDGPATVCAFYVDGSYRALALFIANGEDVRIIPYEY